MAESSAGITVAPEDPRALADAVMRLRANPELLARMGRAGRTYAVDRWERETVLKSTEQKLAAVFNHNITAADLPGTVDVD